MLLLSTTGLCVAAPPAGSPAAENMAAMIDGLRPFERLDSPAMQAIRHGLGASAANRSKAPPPDGVEVGTWQGVVEILSVAPPDARANDKALGLTQAYLHRNGQSDLVFFLNGTPPGFTSGAHLVARGYRRGNRLIAVEADVDAVHRPE